MTGALLQVYVHNCYQNIHWNFHNTLEGIALLVGLSVILAKNRNLKGLRHGDFTDV